MRGCVGVYALLDLFLETAAAESIIYSAGIDIPRMPSSTADPSGENIAVPKGPAHAQTCEEVAFRHIFPKGPKAFSGDALSSRQSSRGHLFL